MVAPGSDQAIVNITKWARRGEWRERLDVIIDAHFGPVLARIGLPVEELPKLLGETFSPLFACVLEDFLTCDFGPEQHSIVADYLKRRGFRESASVRTYLRALRRSVMSVYQAVEMPAGDFVLRDLIRSGDAVRVEDPLTAAGIVTSDLIAARLLSINGKAYLADGVLRLPAERVPDLVKDIKGKRREFRRWLRDEAEQRGRTMAELEALAPLDNALLGELAPVFTQLWLNAVLEPLFETRSATAATAELVSG